MKKKKVIKSFSVDPDEFERFMMSTGALRISASSIIEESIRNWNISHKAETNEVLKKLFK